MMIRCVNNSKIMRHASSMVENGLLPVFATRYGQSSSSSSVIKTSSQRFFHSTPSVLQEPTVLVMGSSGALGSVVAKYLGKDVGMRVIGADIVERPGGGWHPDAFVVSLFY